jgi:hypothetical protein
MSVEIKELTQNLLALNNWSFQKNLLLGTFPGNISGWWIPESYNNRNHCQCDLEGSYGSGTWLRGIRNADENHVEF